MLKFLLEKEFKQFFRNKFLPRLIFGMPISMMVIFPMAANQSIKNVHLDIVDADHSSYSASLINKVSSTDYFLLQRCPQNYSEALKDIEYGYCEAILEIPPHFEKDFRTGAVGSVSISVNAVNGTKGSLAAAYLSSIVSEWASEQKREQGLDILESASMSPKMSLSPQFRFNPSLEYSVFMIPALMVMLLTMLCGFLPALNVVTEREKGTIEQINVTPVGKFQFIIAKLIPYWVLGFFVMTVCFGLAYLIYGLFPVGSFVSIYAAAIVFVLVMSGFGLVISNYSGTMQQAMFVMFFFMLIFILISGLFTPISSMPPLFQKIVLVNPLKYFIEIMRAVYLKGSDLIDLAPKIGALLLFAAFSNTWAILSYRKRN